MKIERQLVAILALVSLVSVAGCATEGATGEPSEDDESGNVETSEDDLVAPSCSPSIAAGTVPRMHRAMLDTIAYTEGTANSCGQDGYNTGFSYKCFKSCARHPNTVWRAGGYSSSAAGRYQFLSRTWSGLRLGEFSPRNQDLGAMKLITRRGASLPTSRPLNATEFTNTIKKLAPEWASLPFSPYGQPRKSLSQTRAAYCAKAGC
jgi:muramidase (phage lysozyme)